MKLDCHIYIFSSRLNSSPLNVFAFVIVFVFDFIIVFFFLVSKQSMWNNPKYFQYFQNYLKEVPSEDELNPTKRPIIAFHRPGHCLQLLEVLSVHHGNLKIQNEYHTHSSSIFYTSSTMRCLHLRHCCATVFLFASCSHFEMTACPVPIPAKE